MIRKLTIVLSSLLLIPVVLGCDLAVEDGEGGEQCLDDYLREVGSDRGRLEAEAEQRGVEASAVLEEIFQRGTGVADALIDCSASEALSDLAEGTGGEYRRSSSPQDAMDAVAAYTAGLEAETIDLVFLLDTTGSMSDDIDAVRRRLNAILAGLEGKQVRVSVATFRDRHVDSPWYARNPSGLVPAGDSEVLDLLQSATAEGGGDFPESLYDGLFAAVGETTWEAEARVVIAITDAPPLSGNASEVSQQEVIQLCVEQRVAVVAILVNVL